jgi:hypothetical protein
MQGFYFGKPKVAVEIWDEFVNKYPQSLPNNTSGDNGNDCDSDSHSGSENAR